MKQRLAFGLNLKYGMIDPNFWSSKNPKRKRSRFKWFPREPGPIWAQREEEKIHSQGLFEPIAEDFLNNQKINY